MKNRRLLWGFLAVGFALVVSGCYHSLEILNEESFNVAPVSDFKKKGLRVALVSVPPVIVPAPTWGGSDEYQKARALKYAKDFVVCERLFLQQVAKSLSRQAGYDVFVTEDEKALAQSDVRIRIQEKVGGSAQGKNFPIGFPGCIIFAYAWNGFAYNVTWNFEAEITVTTTGLPIGTAELRQDMDVRYTSMGGENEDPMGNIMFMPVWYLPPLGTIGAIIESSVASSTYYEPLARIIRDSGKLEPLADKFAQEIVREINARDFQLASAKAEEESRKGKTDARRKDLEDLKKAGIIDEAEYAAEMKKLEGAGK